MLLCSFQKEESVLIDELLRLSDDAAPSARADRHDRHRRAVRRDAADLARVRGALRRGDRGARRQRGPASPWTGPSTAAATPRSPRWSDALAGAEGWITGIRREQGPTRATTELIERDEGRGLWKYNPLADWTDKDLWRRHPRARPAVQPAARPGLRVDRLRPVHPAGKRARGPLGGHRQDRVRHPRCRARSLTR